MSKNQKSVKLPEPTGIEQPQKNDLNADGSVNNEILLVGIAEQLAGCKLTTKNYRIPNAEIHFPHDPLLRRVGKFFKHATGGPLFIDEPTDAAAIQACERKAKAMKLEGLKYLIITKDEDLDVAQAKLKALGPKQKVA